MDLVSDLSSQRWVDGVIGYFIHDVRHPVVSSGLAFPSSPEFGLV